MINHIHETIFLVFIIVFVVDIDQGLFVAAVVIVFVIAGGFGQAVGGFAINRW